MNLKTIVAIVLIALGLVVLAHLALNLTTPGESIHPVGLQVESAVHHIIPLFVGALASAGGILLLPTRTRWPGWVRWVRWV